MWPTNMGPAVGAKSAKHGRGDHPSLRSGEARCIAGGRGTLVSTIASKGSCDPASVADSPSVHLGDDGRADFIRCFWSIWRHGWARLFDHTLCRGGGLVGAGIRRACGENGSRKLAFHEHDRRQPGINLARAKVALSAAMFPRADQVRADPVQEDKIAAVARWGARIPGSGSMSPAFSPLIWPSKALRRLSRSTIGLCLLIGPGLRCSGLMPFPYPADPPRSEGNGDTATNPSSAVRTCPLVFSAALLSFAAWANDVANAVGPLAPRLFNGL